MNTHSVALVEKLTVDGDTTFVGLSRRQLAHQVHGDLSALVTLFHETPSETMCKVRDHRRTPAQTTIPQGTSTSVLSGICSITLLSLTSFTIVLVNISILDCLKVDSVYSINCLENMGKTEGRASTRVMRIRPASSGYQLLRSSSRKSCSSPLSSIPVGPPPTTTYVKVSSKDLSESRWCLTMCRRRSISSSFCPGKAAVSTPVISISLYKPHS